jgi:DNA-binding NarL/FixJ family response regulator
MTLRLLEHSPYLHVPSYNRANGGYHDAMPVSVVVVDDQLLVRAGFRALLDSDPDITVVGEAANGVEAQDVVREAKPDVVLMDVRMPEMDGLEATRRLMEQNPATRVLILTTFDLDEYVYEGLQAGASGFVLKDIDPAELIRAVHVIARGEALLAPSVTRRLIEEFASRRRNGPRVVPARIAELTEREREVLQHIARGLNNDEIASELVISPATAKTHVSRIMSKLEARDRAQLVVIAYESGVVA